MNRVVFIACAALAWVSVFNFQADTSSAHHGSGGSPLATAGNGPEAGKAFWVGYHPLTPPGTYYTFWPAGGEAPLIEWDLPEGFSLGRTRWPDVDNFSDEGAPRFGFSESTVIWQAVRVPEDWDGSTFKIKADLAYYICDEACEQIYETATGDFGGEATPENLGSVSPSSYSLGRLALHANAGTNDDVFIAVNYRMENHTDKVSAVYFLPTVPGLYDVDMPLQLTQSEKEFYAEAFRGYLGITPMSPGAEGNERITGLVVFEMADGSGYQSTTFDRANDYLKIAELEAETRLPEESFTLITAFLFAVLGGLILNIMPCVLPVLALKVFSFLNTSITNPGRLQADGLAYTLGIVLSFAIVGGVLMALRAGGGDIGWGFQMQNPVFVFAMALLIFAIGLNFLGAFDISAGRLAGLGQKLTEKEGPGRAFFTGVLATIVATPCTAPFMAGALAFGLSQSPVVGLVVFIGLGLGLALPYLVLSFVPALGRFLPKPGPWMTTFKQFLAFPLFATVIWLLWILNIQTGARGLLVSLTALLMLALAVWFSGILKKKPLKAALVGVLVIMAVSPAVFADRTLPVVHNNAPPSWEQIELVEYSRDELARLRAENIPVLLHFWAAWCPVCILHEEFVFMTDEFGDYVQDNGIVFMYVDNTVTSDEIWQLIQSFGREGQPIDVFYPPGKEAVVLPELFNIDYLLPRLDQELE